MQEEEVTTEIIPLLSSGRASGSKHDRMGSVMELKRKDQKQNTIMPCGHPNHGAGGPRATQNQKKDWPGRVLEKETYWGSRRTAQNAPKALPRNPRMQKP